MHSRAYELEEVPEDVMSNLVIKEKAFSEKIEELSVLCQEIGQINKVELRSTLANGLSNVLASNMVI
jgi:hypothetical protein